MRLCQAKKTYSPGSLRCWALFYAMRTGPRFWMRRIRNSLLGNAHISARNQVGQNSRDARRQNSSEPPKKRKVLSGIAGFCAARPDTKAVSRSVCPCLSMGFLPTPSSPQLNKNLILFNYFSASQGPGRCSRHHPFPFRAFPAGMCPCAE